MHCLLHRQEGIRTGHERHALSIDRSEDRGAGGLALQRRVQRGAHKIDFAIVFEFDRQQVRPILLVRVDTNEVLRIWLADRDRQQLLFDASRPNEVLRELQCL